MCMRTSMIASRPLPRRPARGARDIDASRSRTTASVIGRIVVPAAVLLAAVLATGCNQIFGIDETQLSPEHAYSCDCSCTGGGQVFTVDSNVCLPEALNPALNADLPDDFVPSAAALQDDCHVRVEQNLEQMARKCFADRIRCTCDAI